SRQIFGQADDSSIWPTLRYLWVQTVDAYEGVGPVDEQQSALLCLSVARFTRNLSAGVPSNQERAFDNEPAIRKLVHRYTSFSVMQDPKSFEITRMLVQTLSNIVTTNEALSQRLWSIYTQLPQKDSILIRLCASPDAKTVSTTFVLILNLIHNSQERAEMLITSATGPRICISLLDCILSLFDAEESTHHSQAFDVGYQILVRLFKAGLVKKLYMRIAVVGEVISPHQTTLLKLLDSYLQSLPYREVVGENDELLQMLTSTFFSLSRHMKIAIKSTLGTAAASERVNLGLSEASISLPLSETPMEPPGYRNPQEIDLLLPKVCEALVLVVQCLTSILLAAELDAPAADAPSTRANRASDLRSPRRYISEVHTADGQDFAEDLVETLRLLDIFIPRIMLGKVAHRPAPPGSEALQQESPPLGLVYIKRDLVRLLGILCAHNHPVQDRVRLCGGIPVIMNMCVIDDQNPYLREHAILALNNLLQDNAENQAVVNEMKPVGRWDAMGNRVGT
ncbi:spinocerebellar ataxia type 10 protein domain-containing protein, partial [Sparassis latifolia]